MRQKPPLHVLGESLGAAMCLCMLSYVENRSVFVGCIVTVSQSVVASQCIRNIPRAQRKRRVNADQGLLLRIDEFILTLLIKTSHGHVDFFHRTGSDNANQAVLSLGSASQSPNNPICT